MASMVALVHHAIDAAEGALSPFVERIHAIAEGSDLCIACPYVGLRVLEPLIGKARSWRMLTDAEELLRSHAPSQRAELIKFLVEHGARVRHWPGLHAKVVVGDHAALVGSANLTEAGMGSRQEMAVHLDEPRLLVELRAWFDELWRRCDAPLPEALEGFASGLPRPLPEPSGVHLESPAPQLSAVVFPRTKASDDAADDARLSSRLATGVNREWVNAYLDMCADLLRTLEIPDDDARLSMSVPSSRNALPVTINQRYVLCAFHKGEKVIGLMLPRGFKVPSELVPALNRVRDHLGSFRPWRDEEPEEAPHFGYFEVEHPRQLAPLRDAWLLAVMQETQRAWKQSSFRRHHVRAFFRAAVDHEYRGRLLAEAFSGQPQA